MEFLHMVEVMAHLILSLSGTPKAQHSDFMACWYVPARVVSVERAACDIEVQDDAAGQEFMRVWADAHKYEVLSMTDDVDVAPPKRVYVLAY